MIVIPRTESVYDCHVTSARKITMAKRRPESRNPSIEEMRAALPRLRRRVEELKALDPAALSKRYDPVFESVAGKANQVLAELYGAETPEYWRFSVHLDRASINMAYESPLSEVREGYREGLADAIAKIQSLVELFEEQVDLPERHEQPAAIVQDATVRPVPARKVFIVHGHDEAAKLEVARFVERLGLEPIVLHEQLNRGQTIIEKFERHAAEAGFAIVLLTPDDMGYRAGQQDQAVARARQNVILELGFFVGALGRQNVVALNKGVEIPTDLQGVIYEPMDERGAWRTNLAREMRSAGIAVDMNRL